jgi:hypothetical protein
MLGNGRDRAIPKAKSCVLTQLKEVWYTGSNIIPPNTLTHLVIRL